MLPARVLDRHSTESSMLLLLLPLRMRMLVRMPQHALHAGFRWACNNQLYPICHPEVAVSILFHTGRLCTHLILVAFT